MRPKTVVALIGLLASASSVQAQHYKVYAGGYIIDSVTNARTQQACPAGNRLAIAPDGTAFGFNGAVVPLDDTRCDIPSGNIPGQTLVMAPNGQQMLLIDAGGNQIVYADTRTGRYKVGQTGLPSSVFYDEILGTYSIQSPVPLALAVSPDGATAFVSGRDPSNITRIRTATMESETFASSPSSNSPRGIAMKWADAPADRVLYIANGNVVSVFNALYLDRITDIPVEYGPSAIVVNRHAERAYVAHRNGPVTVIDTARNTVLTTIPIPGLPPSDGFHDPAYMSIALTPDGKTLFVGGPIAPLVKIDVATGTVVSTMDLGQGVFDVAIAPLRFASFNASVTFTGTKGTLDGTFTLGAGSNGFDLAVEDITLSIGERSMWIGAGTFQPDPNQPGTFHFEQPMETSTVPTYMRATISAGGGPGVYQIHATTETMNPGTPDDPGGIPTQVLLAVGDDAGSAPIDLSSPLDQQIATLLTDLSAAQANVAALSAQNDALVQENATLLGRVAQLTTDNSQLTIDNAQLTTLVTALSATNTELTTQLAQATDALTAERATVAALEAQIAELGATNDRLRTQIATLKEKVATLQARIEMLQAKIDTLQAKIDVLQARIERLQNR